MPQLSKNLIMSWKLSGTYSHKESENANTKEDASLAKLNCQLVYLDGNVNNDKT